ncbi:phosphoribosyl-ATP diphosphatase [Methanosphaerula palustris]|uniref:Phosphoribosyl-ATP pyrophosphatase n=1 Tax=Methanosphaerula palustris (strain ATCC BAA-1556 / DSM 19958 / E1-9c) TaxID=521011 RepID=HIS2_METPE|nr:phosphoribosyl-ATP diphosphatase [Methanosphaerula palustris]B8GKC9.1 RecName: Full=Phosphoribosyl-ATP pyrophosphatase; Short=PRA-PH [Methanosphaerula palustris E1-9c]ACL15812.1 phosphoribosyl-ATP diphosphatase [Methanosphaerula palustris E1-9c]
MTDTALIAELWDVIVDRRLHPVEGSYVNSLLSHRKGIDKPLEKVGEEATEFILAVKNGESDRIAEEAADLLFHMLVALNAADVDLSLVLDELASRRRSR